jgi:hypothetical protein
MELRKEAVLILAMSMSQGGETLPLQLVDETMRTNLLNNVRDKSTRHKRKATTPHWKCSSKTSISKK